MPSGSIFEIHRSRVVFTRSPWPFLGRFIVVVHHFVVPLYHLIRYMGGSS
jgi:hypothetical protein